ncbi:MAG: PQQ-binding-like beta-propeller repeat protein [Verrucomicrobiales bacterium]
MQATLRYLSLALCLLSGPTAFAWIRLKGMTHLNWALPAAAILWAALLGIWYLVFGEARFKVRALRVGLAAGLFLLLASTGALLLRYEGSASGSSFPKFSWVWEDETDLAEETPVIVRPELPAPLSELKSAAGDVTQFLGPDRNGTWSERPFGVDWDENSPALIWRRPIGKAWSSFVVEEGKAITQEQAGDEERVVCLDLFTGEERWRHADPGVRLLLVREENAGAAMGGDGPRSTPTIHADRVYSLGATGILNCLDLESGERVWSRNIVADHDGRLQKWGMANAPLVLAEHGTVVVPGSDKKGATLIAYELDTGEEAWVYRGRGASYSSPRLTTLAGIRQLVSVNAVDATGHEPATGSLLWKYDWPGHYPRVGQPIRVGDDKLLLTASYGAGSPLIRIEKEGDSWTATEVWKSMRMKTKFSSAVVRDGFAYGLDEGRLACIDLESGDKVWKNQKYGFGQQLLFDDWLLIQTEPGAVVVGRASPEGFTERGRLEALDSMTWNAPAVAGRLLLVRNDREAACYLLPPRR